MKPRNRRFSELLDEVNEASRARMKRETVSDVTLVLFALLVAMAVLTYWGRHGWPW